jgi:Flp pilus assembly protein TadG
MIRAFRAHWQSFRRNQHGAVVIETAFIAPLLALLGLGAFQVSEAVARQHELQAGADDAAAMALAGWNDDASQMTALESVLKSTLALTDDQVTITHKYRCGTTTDYVDDKTTCAAGSLVTTYLRIVLTDTYTPTWADFGVGDPITYNVTRTVVLS